MMIYPQLLNVVEWSEIFDKQTISSLIESIAILAIGTPFILLLAKLAEYTIRKRFKSLHLSQITRKMIIYTGYVFIGVLVLLAFDINVSAILGTAGIATLAFGYAGRTSLSNLVSGFFLLGEKPFEIGDVVEFRGRRGYVQSIDLLSVKINTLNHLSVRIPNDSIMQEEFINVSKYPIRRMDVIIKIDYKEDIRRICEILREVASKNEYALEEPEPTLFLQDFGDSYFHLLFGVWFERDNFIITQNTMLIEIKERFDKEGIKIPVPYFELKSDNPLNQPINAKA